MYKAVIHGISHDLTRLVKGKGRKYDLLHAFNNFARGATLVCYRHVSRGGGGGGGSLARRAILPPKRTPAQSSYSYNTYNLHVSIIIAQ